MSQAQYWNTPNIVMTQKLFKLFCRRKAPVKITDLKLSYLPMFQNFLHMYFFVFKVSDCTSLDDLLYATEPLQDYLANAGCLRPLKHIEDRDLLVQDILMFQVVHRVCGAFERFV